MKEMAAQVEAVRQAKLLCSRVNADEPTKVQVMAFYKGTVFPKSKIFNNFDE
jgi:hypothetical protein